MIVSIIANDDQQDATILAYLFIPSQLNMFRAISSPIIKSTWLYLQFLILSTLLFIPNAKLNSDLQKFPSHACDLETFGNKSLTSHSEETKKVDNIRSCKYSQVLLKMGDTRVELIRNK